MPSCLGQRCVGVRLVYGPELCRVVACFTVEDSLLDRAFAGSLSFARCQETVVSSIPRRCERGGTRWRGVYPRGTSCADGRTSASRAFCSGCAFRRPDKPRGVCSAVVAKASAGYCAHDRTLWRLANARVLNITHMHTAQLQAGHCAPCTFFPSSSLLAFRPNRLTSAPLPRLNLQAASTANPLLSLPPPITRDNFSLSRRTWKTRLSETSPSTSWLWPTRTRPRA